MKTEIKSRELDKITVSATLTVEERDDMQSASLTWMDEFTWSVKRKVLQAEFHAPELHDATIVCTTLVLGGNCGENLDYQFEIKFDGKKMLMTDIETIEYQSNQDRGILEDINTRGGNYSFEGLTGQIDEACCERDYLCKVMRKMLEAK